MKIISISAYVSSLITALLFTSCTHMYFENPMPYEGIALNEFPKELQGTYIENQDTIKILPLEYVSTSSSEWVVASNEIPSTVEINGNYWRDEIHTHHQWMPILQKGDTLTLSYVDEDHEYLSENKILKKFGDMWVLSTKDSSYWEIVILNKSKKQLEVYSPIDISSNSKTDENTKALSKFSKITPIQKIDSESYVLNPTEKQLKKLFKKKFFKSVMVLKQI